ncbi:hypothetical protein ACLOJK_037361 [Asimina triloba]
MPQCRTVLLIVYLTDVLPRSADTLPLPTRDATDWRKLLWRRMARRRRQRRRVRGVSAWQVAGSGGVDDEATEAGLSSVRCMWCCLIQDQANIAGVMGGLDHSIQGPVVALVEADGLEEN